MQTTINGNHYQITTQLREYTHKKLDKLKSYEDIITQTHITFSQERLKYIAQGHISVPGNQLVAKGEGESMTAAMDSLIDKLLNLMKKHKSKTSERR